MIYFTQKKEKKKRSNTPNRTVIDIHHITIVHKKVHNIYTLRLTSIRSARDACTSGTYGTIWFSVDVNVTRTSPYTSSHRYVADESP